MTLIKTSGLAALAIAALVCTSVDAAAQAPALTGSVSGNRLTIQWTTVAGATGYRLEVGSSSGATNIAVVNGPTSITHLSVDAPNGRYFIRIRATAGATIGPASNELDLAVPTAGGGPSPTPTPGPNPCAVTPPTVSAQVNGGFVTVSWSAVAGAIGYRVELGRGPGATELSETVGASTTAYQRYIGQTGTFYARVVVGTSCAQATSSEITFTITDLAGGGGPRTPNPPAGAILPLPNMFAVVDQVARQYPHDLRNSCREHGGTNVWLFRLLQTLRQTDSRWGLNWKRGHRGDMSQDIVTYNGTAGTDEGATHVYVIDVIGGHCGSNPQPGWTDVTAATWAGGASGNPACANRDCAEWTLQPYLQAGFPPDRR